MNLLKHKTPEQLRAVQRRQLLQIGVAMLFMLGLGYLLYWVSHGQSVMARKVVPDVVQLKLMEPPPPPPPPPPPKMVEQPKMRELVERQPTPVENKPLPPKLNNAAPPPGPLALDAKGQGPSDDFGLGGRPGGSDLLGGGGGGGSPYGWYASMLEGRLQDLLQHQRRLHGSRYDVAVSLWLGPDGTLQRVELVGSSGKPDVDQNLDQALQKMPRLPQPPQGMPQPIVLQVSSS